MKNHTFFLFKRQSNLFTYLFILLTPYCFSQEITINTPNPLGVFHIDAKGDNPSKGIPSQKEQDNDFVIKVNGNVGIGTAFPTNKLHIVANENFTPLIIDKLPLGDIMKDEVLVINENNIIQKSFSTKNIFVPQYAVFRLNNSIESFLINAEKGEIEKIPMTLLYYTISGLLYDRFNAKITFPKGTYQVELTYSAERKQCQYSSYFIEFLDGDFATTQSHNTQKHKNSTEAHTGQFTHVFTLNHSHSWEIHLGRGRAGECTGFGTTLLKYSTQLIVTKLN